MRLLWCPSSHEACALNLNCGLWPLSRPHVIISCLQASLPAGVDPKRQDTYCQEVRERGQGHEDLQHVPTAREAIAHIARLAGAVHICKGGAQGPCQ